MAKKYLRYTGAGRIGYKGTVWASDDQRAVQGVDADVAKELTETYPDVFEEARAEDAKTLVPQRVESPMGDVRWENAAGNIGVLESGVAESVSEGGDK